MTEADGGDLVALKAKLVAAAEADNACYPQYRGHWAGPEWRIARINKDTRTKMGLAFEQHEVVLCRNESLGFAMAYSSKNRINTLVRAGDIAWISGPESAKDNRHLSDEQRLQMAANTLAAADANKQRVTERDLLCAIPLINKATSMGFNGFGGNCFASAVAMNRILFDGKLSFFIAVNDALHAAGRTIGHATLFVEDAKGIRCHIDADGRIKSDIDVQSWGMLDVEDAEYEEIASELGLEWNEDTAGTVALFEATEAQILQFANDMQLVGELEFILRRAAEELGRELASPEASDLAP